MYVSMHQLYPFLLFLYYSLYTPYAYHITDLPKLKYRYSVPRSMIVSYSYYETRFHRANLSNNACQIRRQQNMSQLHPKRPNLLAAYHFPDSLVETSLYQSNYGKYFVRIGLVVNTRVHDTFPF